VVRHCCPLFLPCAAGLPLLLPGRNFPIIAGMPLINRLSLSSQKEPNSQAGKCQYYKLKLFNCDWNFRGDANGTILSFIVGFSATQGDMAVVF